MTTAEDWSGRVGDTWADAWQRTDRSFADLSRYLDAAILAAVPAGRFRALDIGCGAGETSLALAAARPDAAIVGVDLSRRLVAVARARLAECSDPVDVRFVCADAARTAEADAPIDLFHSRHGVMFFSDPVATFTMFARGAAPAARMVFSCFRDWESNGFACEVGAAVGIDGPSPGPGPFAFADDATVARILSAAGWHIDGMAAVDFAYRAGAGADPVGEALDLFQRIGPAASVLRAIDPAERAAALGRVHAVVERYRNGDTVDFPAAAWIFTATVRRG